MVNVPRAIGKHPDHRGANNLGSRGLAWRSDGRSDAAPEVDRLRNRSLSQSGYRQPEGESRGEDEPLHEDHGALDENPAAVATAPAAQTDTSGAAAAAISTVSPDLALAGRILGT